MDTQGIKAWFSHYLGVPVPVAGTDERTFIKLRVESKLRLQETVTDHEAMSRFQSALRWFGLLIESDRDSAAGYAPGQFDMSPRLKSGHLDRFRQAGDFGSTADDKVRKARELVFSSASDAAERHGNGSCHLWTLTVPTGLERRSRLLVGQPNAGRSVSPPVRIDLQSSTPYRSPASSIRTLP